MSDITSTFKAYIESLNSKDWSKVSPYFSPHFKMIQAGKAVCVSNLESYGKVLTDHHWNICDGHRFVSLEEADFNDTTKETIDRVGRENVKRVHTRMEQHVKDTWSEAEEYYTYEKIDGEWKIALEDFMTSGYPKEVEDEMRMNN